MDKHFFDSLHDTVRNSLLKLALYTKSLPTNTLRTAQRAELAKISKAMGECARKCGNDE